MSCITQILKLKGDKPVLLPLGENGKPWIAVEDGGTYKDHEYLIVMNTMGHRCGYVAIPTDHPFDKTKLEESEFLGRKRDHYNYFSLDISCHGGLTFMDRHHGLKDLLSVPCNDFWIGFDCGHYRDASDIECAEKYFQIDESRHESLSLMSQEGTIREFDYAERECHRIIDQLIETKEAA
jgi:hypothetical protein